MPFFLVLENTYSLSEVTNTTNTQTQTQTQTQQKNTQMVKCKDWDII